MAPSTDRRSLRSLRSDRDDSKERGVAFYTFVSLLGYPGHVCDSPGQVRRTTTDPLEFASAIRLN